MSVMILAHVNGNSVTYISTNLLAEKGYSQSTLLVTKQESSKSFTKFSLSKKLA